MTRRIGGAAFRLSNEMMGKERTNEGTFCMEGHFSGFIVASSCILRRSKSPLAWGWTVDVDAVVSHDLEEGICTNASFCSYCTGARCS